MPIPFIARQASRFDRGDGANYRKSRHSVFDWRCTRCDKLLGVCKDGQLHLRFSQGHEYFVGFPATAICRGSPVFHWAGILLRPKRNLPTAPEKSSGFPLTGRARISRKALSSVLLRSSTSFGTMRAKKLSKIGSPERCCRAEVSGTCTVIFMDRSGG